MASGGTPSGGRASSGDDEVTIVEADITDDGAQHAVYELMVAAYAVEQAAPPLPGEAEVLAMVRSGDPGRMSVRVVTARVGGRLVGAALVRFPHQDNRHTVWVLPLVVGPGLRRRGVGRVLLAAVAADARAAGRTVLLGQVSQLGPEEPSAGRSFAAAVGATVDGRSLEQVLDVAAAVAGLPPDLITPDLIAPGSSAPDPMPADTYEVLDWTDAAPADLVEAWARLRGRMSTDTPVDDRPDEPEVWDTDRVRDSERQFTVQGRTCLVSAARDRVSGELVAYTMVSVAVAEPGTAFQEDTLVASGHRGHGLGLRLKRRTLGRLAVASPATVELLTWNSSTNGPMLAVNAALGYRVRAEELRVRLEI